MQQKHQNLEYKWNTACSWMYHLMFLGQDFSTINGRIKKSQISRSCTKMILIHAVFSLSGSNQQILPPDKGLLTPFNRLNVYYNGRFQKISILYHGRLLEFPKGRGGSRLWNSEGMGGGGYLRLEIRRHGGIPQVRDFWSRKCEFLENAIVVDFCSL